MNHARTVADRGHSDVSVDGEWSFAQTLRHLVMATDAWPGRAVLQREQPFHPIGQPNPEYETDGACGEESPECSFVGLIPKPDVTLGVDRDTLFSRLGADAPELTCVLQVARTLERRTATLHSLASASDLLRFDDDQGLGRDGMDKFLVEVMRMLEGMGLLEAPRHPGIAVTPLAIYRQVPQSTELSSELTDED